MKKLVPQNPLFFAFFFPAVMDGILTLLGQGSNYWSAVRIVNEASPVYYILLTSPWLYLLGGVIWFVFWNWVFKRLKEPFNIFILMFLFIAGHSWGSSGWIMKIFKDVGIYTLGNQPSIIFAWGLLIIYFMIIACIATYCLRIHLGEKLKK